MAIPIGYYSLQDGTHNNDRPHPVLPGQAYFALGGNDILTGKGTTYLQDQGLYWAVPSILVGGDGNDDYIIGPDASSIVADASHNSNSDRLTIHQLTSDITQLYSIENRHVFLGFYSGESILIIDALNDSGQIETIDFRDTVISGRAETLSYIVRHYATIGDQTFDSMINANLFNPRVMGISGAEETRTIIELL